MKPDLRWTAVMVCALAAITAASASAQEYPQRPIRMIVGLPTGGSTDLMGRLLAAKLGERFGQQAVFDNRPGASGRTRAVNRAPACGM
jgi:tripartite-type tricarboxylate transporter receptor subunit TctC